MVAIAGAGRLESKVEAKTHGKIGEESEWEVAKRIAKPNIYNTNQASAEEGPNKLIRERL